MFPVCLISLVSSKIAGILKLSNISFAFWDSLTSRKFSILNLNNFVFISVLFNNYIL